MSCYSTEPDHDGEGLYRCDDRFIHDLYIALTGDDPAEVNADRLRHRLYERLSEDQVESVKGSYLLCLSVSETVRRLQRAEYPTEVGYECGCGEVFTAHLVAPIEEVCKHVEGCDDAPQMLKDVCSSRNGETGEQ